MHREENKSFLWINISSLYTEIQIADIKITAK